MTDMTITTDVLPEAKFKIFTGLLKAFEAEGDGAPLLAGVASSTTRDHHGDVMLESALRDMEAAANDNMTIFLNHSYNVPEDVAGSVKRAMVVQRGYDSDGNPNWDLDMEIAINRENDRAVKSWTSIKNGTKLGLSIGAMIPQGGATRDKETGALTISRVNLLETSIVSIPANPRSWISNAVKALNMAEAEAVQTDYFEVSETGTTSTYIITTSSDTEYLPTITWSSSSGDVCAGCGGSKRKPKDGCDADFHSDIEDEVEAAQEAADVSASQEATQSEPENGDGADVEAVNDAADLESIDAVAKAGVASVLALLETTTAKLVDAREQVASEKQAREQAESQRDEAVQAANEVFAQAHAIFERLAETKIGRKTAFVETRNDFDDLSGIYSEKFRRLLKQGG